MTMIEQQNKYGSLCSHDFHKSLTNEIELHCNQNANLIHHISQYGKICNKCTHIIKNSTIYEKNCIVCTDTIQQYLNDRELCQHENRQYEDINIDCLNQTGKSHQILLKTKICNRCSDKLKATFMDSETCKVCQGKQFEIVKDMGKTFISPAFSHFKNLIDLHKAAGSPSQLFKNQIQSTCKAQPKVERKQNGVISSKIIQASNAQNPEDSHLSKRYKLYPKCPTHRDNFITVCNLCLVALLNLDCCPYGCIEQKKGAKVKKDTQIKFYQTGFFIPYPIATENSYFLELFVIKLVEERGRLDRWQATVKKILPKTQLQKKYIQKFALYSAVVAIDKRNYFVTGGVVGDKISKMTPTNHAFGLSFSNDLKEFEIFELLPMHQARTGHSLVYNQSRKMVFAIGGFLKGEGYSKSTEVYSILQKKWFKISDLNVERSKPTTLIYQDSIYVFGGLTTNYEIIDCLGQKFNYVSQKWQKIPYNGFDYPFLTHSTASTSLSAFQNKKNIMLFGGANSNQYSPLIQTLNINQKDFELNSDGRYYKMNCARAGCTLGLIGEDTLIIFGGLEQYQSLLSLDAVKLRITETEISPLYVTDQIQIGSYRLSIRENADVVYKRLYNELQRKDLISEQKLDTEDKNFTNGYNCQLIERLWYSVGKNYVWIPI